MTAGRVGVGGQTRVPLPSAPQYRLHRIPHTPYVAAPARLHYVSVVSRALLGGQVTHHSMDQVPLVPKHPVPVPAPAPTSTRRPSHPSRLSRTTTQRDLSPLYATAAPGAQSTPAAPTKRKHRRFSSVPAFLRPSGKKKKMKSSKESGGHRYKPLPGDDAGLGSSAGGSSVSPAEATPAIPPPAVPHHKAKYVPDDRVAQVQAAVGEVHVAMRENLDRVVARGETLNEIEEKTLALMDVAGNFRTNTGALRASMQQRSYVCYAIAALAVLAVLTAVSLVVVGWVCGGLSCQHTAPTPPSVPPVLSPSPHTPLPVPPTPTPTPPALPPAATPAPIPVPSATPPPSPSPVPVLPSVPPAPAARSGYIDIQPSSGRIDIQPSSGRIDIQPSSGRIKLPPSDIKLPPSDIKLPPSDIKRHRRDL